ncbi:hypothetical protein P3W24_03890 [Luteibacter sp. PPL201]|uniref:Uncharacterized protein n=1 Tax=Luteibacter sahnii TaxID=3021977 RepID=A0ABT6B7Q5_9GAMM
MTMRRPMLDPIGRVAAGGLNLTVLATLVQATAAREGDILVSMDSDGEVYCTPPKHPFSQAMLRQYSNCVVGTITPTSKVDDIREDLAATLEGHRSAA